MLVRAAQVVLSDLPLMASLPEVIPSTAELAKGHGATSQLLIRGGELTWDQEGALCCLPCLPYRDGLALCEIGLEEQVVT